MGQVLGVGGNRRAEIVGRYILNSAGKRRYFVDFYIIQSTSEKNNVVVRLLPPRTHPSEPTLT
jgi:hypothetical protein